MYITVSNEFDESFNMCNCSSHLCITSAHHLCWRITKSMNGKSNQHAHRLQQPMSPCSLPHIFCKMKKTTQYIPRWSALDLSIANLFHENLSANSFYPFRTLFSICSPSPYSLAVFLYLKFHTHNTAKKLLDKHAVFLIPLYLLWPTCGHYSGVF